jgi:leader peptidase (prepilin peptidase)/N-methyltransferase
LIQAILALVFGLLIGSFLNVCVHRWPRGRSVVKPRSHCVRCRKMIAWYDNIPLVSYLLLRGKCRHCGRHISARYPTVELLTGLLFFFFVYSLGVTLLALKMCVFSAMLVALVFSDLEKRILPDELTKGGIVLGLIFSIFVRVEDNTAQAILWLCGVPDLTEPFPSIAESAFGALLPTAFLWLGGWIYWKVRKREGLGLGDVKLIAMVGAFLGLRGAMLTLVIGSLSGSLLGTLYIKATRQEMATYELPFGTFLGFSGILAAMVGQKMLGW